MKKCVLIAVLFSSVIACSNNNDKSGTPSDTQKMESTPQAEMESAPLSVATPNIYEFTSGPQGPVSIHIYSEDDIWIIEQNIIDVDGLPTPQGRWTFTTKEKAYAFAKDNLGISESHRNDTALDVTFEDEILFSENLKNENVLWDVKNTWSWDWEIAFAKWMRENLHPDFFEKLGIENDCADAYYQARMIFAFENKLPVTFRLAGSGAVFTQNVVRPEWKKLKADTDWRKNKRFLKALDYIANTTYTHTLGRDTYPMEISEQGLIEGTAFLYLDEHSGHTLLVNEINLGTGSESKTRLPMYTLNSTVPKTVRPLYESMFYEGSQPKKSKIGNTGFVRFRWPKSSGSKNLVEAKDMPYYSEEQYDPEFMDAVSEEGDYQNFSITVFKRLNPDFDPTLRITEGLEEVSDMIEARKEVILEGYEVCKKGCAEGSADYENWSTPSRDKRIKALIQDLEKYQSALYAFKAVEQAWSAALKSNIVELDGASYLLSHVKWTFDNDFHSSDPNQTPQVRWGLAPEAFAQAAYAQVNPLLAARKEKVAQKNDCSSSAACLVFSDKYISASTFIEDQDIQNSIAKRNEYCSIAGDNACSTFKSQLSSLSTVAPGHANFLETWDKISILNSDPRVPEAQRWGAMPSNLDTVIFDESYFPVGRFQSTFVLTSETYPLVKVVLLDIPTQMVTPLYTFNKSGYTTLNEKTGLMISIDYETFQMHIVDVTTRKEQTLTLPNATSTPDTGFYANVVWIDEAHFVVAYQNKLAVYSLSDDQYVETAYFDGYYVLGTRYGYATVNLEKVETAPSNFQITIVDLLDSSKAPIVVSMNSVLPNIHPTYVSVSDIVTSEAMLLSWSKYTDTQSLTGSVIVDIITGTVKPAGDLKGYISKLVDGVATSSSYNDQTSESTTIFYFLNNDLSVKNQVRVKGSCSNCYSISKNLQIGADIYSIDVANQKLVKTMTIVGLPKTASASISGIYENYAIVNFYDESISYSTLMDLKTGKAILVGEGINFGNNSPGMYPTIAMSQYHTIGTGEAAKYYSLNVVLDLDNLNGGPLLTPMYSEYEGGEHEYEGEYIEEGEMSQTIDAVVKTMPQPEDVPFSIKVLDPSAIEDKDDNVTILNQNGQKTIVIFR